MGGNSTSHRGALLGSQTKISGKTFDVHSWQGLTEILQVAKTTLKDPHAYAEFRNLVLHYAQQGGDKESREKIDAIIRTFNEPLSTPPSRPSPVFKSTPSPQRGTGGGITVKIRREPMDVATRAPLAPDVRIHKSTHIPTRRSSPQFIRSETKSPIVRTIGQKDFELPILPGEEESVATPPLEQKVNPANVVAKDDHKQNGSAPAFTSSNTPWGITPKSQTETVPLAPSVSVTPKETPQAFKSMDEHKVRIAEIKRAVHNTVGNPATLIDTHNEVGKKYMVALLTALKATGPGSTIGIDVAMAKLEEAYLNLRGDTQSVVGTTKQNVPIDARPSETIAVVSKPPVPIAPPLVKKEHTSTKEESTTYISKQAPGVISPVQIVPEIQKPQRTMTEGDVNIKKIPETKQTATPIVTNVLKPSVPPLPQKTAPTGTESTLTQTPKIPAKPLPKKDVAFVTTAAPKVSVVPDALFGVTPSETPTAVPRSPALIAPEQKKQTETPVKEVPTTPSAPIPVSVISPNIPPAPSAVWKQNKHIVKHTALQQSVLANAPHAEVAEEKAVHQVELSQQKITKALDALLHEWPLFSSSGILGIGPGGLEHPLYRRLATLSMGEVMSGRFERADAKVIKVLKQYVDGWRHEQGIAYTINETFDHYLRRVVQRILKRQNM